MTLNLKRMLDTAGVLLEQRGNLRDSESRGTLRGGSCGWMSEEGDVVGTCPRRAWARKEGYVLEDNSSKQPMFQGGHLSEEGILELLELTWEGKILQEEELPITWQTSNGTFVTGRPDIALCDASGVPAHGIEAKLVSSLWTALDVIQLPKTIHVIQAMHYAKKLKLPWSLLYVNRTNWALLSDFAMRKAPRQGEPGSEYVEYVQRRKRIKDKKTGKEKEIEFVEGKAMLPFHHVYPLRFNEAGEVEFEVRGDWFPSFISWEGIERYYEFVSKIEETGNLGPKPVEVSVTGEEKGFDICKYCPLQAKCGGREMSIDSFRSLCEDTHRSVHEGHVTKLRNLT